MMKKYVLSICSIAVFLLISCHDSDDRVISDFDRKSMLEDLATKLVIPNFERLQTGTNEMDQAIKDFNENPTNENLVAARSSWLNAVLDLQHCSAFGFGPGNLLLGPFATVLGVFPVDEEQVEKLILNPDFNLSSSFLRDVRGFYVVEYLLYGNNATNEQIIAGFDQNRKNYLALIISEIKTSVDGMTAEWKETYLQQFTSNNETSAGSSVSLLYNEFVKDYEHLKNFKVELPAGLTAGQKGADPTLVEAFYSGESNRLIKENFENSKNIWYGRTRSGEDIIGFQEYLRKVVGGEVLIEATELAIQGIDSAIQALPVGRLSDNVESTEVATLRKLLQENTPNFKSSMSSLLGISITFNSGDGD